MPINYQDNSAEALQSLKNVLFHNMVEYSFAPNKMNRLGDAKGPVVGGNLAILQSLSGTKYDTSTDGKILFLEDVDEYLYSFERMLYHMRDANMFEEINGLPAIYFKGQGGLLDINYPLRSDLYRCAF